MFTRNVIRILVAILVAFATAFGGVVAAQAADADNAPGLGASVSVSGRWYGAIALAFDDGAVGWSYDFKTKRKAFTRALRECKKYSDFPSSCRKIAWVRNGCLAVAVLWDGSMVANYGWGSALSKRKAYLNALANCGPDCKRRVYTCTRR